MKSVLKLCIAVLFTFVVSFMTTNSALALGQFSLTCRNTSIQGSVLTSTCERASGGVYKTSSINLNPEVENVNGSLKWQPGNFIETCRGTQLVGSRLSAQCKTRAQQWVSTTINLDDHIANIDGTLKYE
ncbi:cyanovirin [Nostoc sp. FACHB-87]|uniref:mannose-binding lectin n=1 Tax=Nostocales TaxID=1161 RepID=UPI001682664C|nr:MULTISPECIES: CVNH domain-containing protein [Nostocales]MBD2299226.1 cyanovirin [Nostoc sp. FACHB-190]MBD2456040.1 cyanovirin [Nostoc sp. FACHB-87]MBD2476536.1 cyanovirin [Anabaena sp. FACHB-83]MBD2486529.1 cyanovirin [Aulosira sp. FACHB-615]